MASNARVFGKGKLRNFKFVFGFAGMGEKLCCVIGAVSDSCQVFLRGWFSKDKKMLMHYQVELLFFGNPFPSFSRVAVVLYFDDILF